MPVFAYAATDEAGKLVRGRYEAATEELLAAALAERGYTVDTITDDSANLEDTSTILFNAIMMQAIADDASDIMIEPERETVRLRYLIHNEVREEAELSREFLEPLLQRIRLCADITPVEQPIPQDGRLRVEMHNKSWDLHINTSPTEYGDKVAIGIFPRHAD